MAKRRRDIDSDGTTPASSVGHPLFVETSIDTRLVMLVSISENVSDFKRKIASEHMQCFPQFGEIEVHSLKVQRRGSFYHLTDVMHVWTAFLGVKGSWFLHVDASSSLSCAKEKPLELGASGGMEIDERNIGDRHRDLPALTLFLEDRATEKDAVNDELRIEPNNNLTSTESPVKKKRKLIQGEDSGPSITLEDNCDVVVPASDKMESPMAGAVGEAAEVILNEDQREKTPMLEAATEDSSMRNRQSYIENGLLFDGTTLPAEAVEDDSQSTLKSQNLSGSDPKGLSENFVASKPGIRPEKYNMTEKEVGEIVRVPYLSGKTMDLDGESGGISSEGVKRRKRKSCKSAPKTRDAPVAEDNVNQGEINTHTTETYTAEEKEGKDTEHTDAGKEAETKFSKIGDEEPMSFQLKASVIIGPGTVPNQASCSESMLESNVVLEPESLSQKKKKKKSGNKYVSTNFESSGAELADIIVSEVAVNEKLMTDKVEREPEQNFAIKQSQGCSGEVQNSRGKLVDTDCGPGEINSDRDRRKKKKKSNRTDPQVLDKPVGEQQASKAISVSAGPESLTSEEKKGHNDLSQRLMKSSEGKLKSDSTHQKITPNEGSCFQQMSESNIEAKRDISVTSQKKKKKKSGKKTVGTNLENSAVEKTDNGITASSSLIVTDNIPLETVKGGAIQNNNMNDVLMETNDHSNASLSNKVGDADSIEMVLTQPEKYLEGIADDKQKIGEKTKNSANYTDVVESNQEEKCTVNTQNKDKKAKKGKTKKVKASSSDVQASISNNNLQVNSVPLSTEENIGNQVHLEQENRHVASSLVLPTESNEKLGGMQGTAVDADGYPEPVENVDEGIINFKNYFVPGESKDDVSDVEKTRKPNVRVKTSKKVKKHPLPSVRNSSELQGTESKDDAADVEKTRKPNERVKSRKKVTKHSLPSLRNSSDIQDPDKSLDNLKSEDRARKGTPKHGDTEHSDSDKVVRGSIKRSSITSGDEVKNPSPFDIMETRTPEKPINVLGICSQPKEEEKALDKSSTERSQAFPEKKGRKKLQSDQKGETTKSATKVSQEKSLLSGLGPIFQDMSGESCAGENEAVYSDARVGSSSDSSSTSDSSDGESNLSLTANRNGPIGRGAGATKVSDLELSNVSKDITMDMILRKSKRFKKATEMLASQNEDEEIEFVPESQAVDGVL